MLTRDEARSFYDAFGRKQDDQAWYEEPALDVAIAHGRFGDAGAVFEFGCGTGRFARRLFDDHLPPDARYLGVDLSTTMTGLARECLAFYAERAEVRLCDGAAESGEPAASFDRFVSSYVLDLLPEAEIRALLREARHILKPGGILVLVGLTLGTGLLPRLVSTLWRLVHRARPRLVGGCRPIVVHDFLEPRSWALVHRETVECRGLSSEVLVASRLVAPES